MGRWPVPVFCPPLEIVNGGLQAFVGSYPPAGGCETHASSWVSVGSFEVGRPLVPVRIGWSRM